MLALLRSSLRQRRVNVCALKQLSTLCNGEEITTTIPCRAMLYIPGSDKSKLAKIHKLKVDCVVLNCEDGVATNMKVTARSNIVEFLNQPDLSHIKSTLSVRINDLHSAFFNDDLKAFLCTETLPNTILFPKVHDPDEVIKIVDTFHKYNVNNATLNAFFYIESAKAVMYLKEICKTAVEHGANKLIPTGLIFGGDDYLANVGVAKTTTYNEVAYARQKIVNVGKAFGLQCIDIVHNNFKDLNELEEQCKQGVAMGYTGKQVIHPLQIETVQRCFLPTAEQQEWATALLKEYEAHQADGHGAFIFRGNMIDAPLMKQARYIVQVTKQHKQ